MRTHPQYPLAFSNHLYFLLTHLYERSFMTPTHLSKILMLVILSKPWFTPENALDNLPTEKDKYKITRLKVDDLDTLECIDPDIKNYTIYFGRGAQDCLYTAKLELFEETPFEAFLAPNTSAQNFIFWNYPNFGESKKEILNSPYELYEAGYRQIKRLILGNVPKVY